MWSAKIPASIAGYLPRDAASASPAWNRPCSATPVEHLDRECDLGNGATLPNGPSKTAPQRGTCFVGFARLNSSSSTRPF